jgi:hypothetical protein
MATRQKVTVLFSPTYSFCTWGSFLGLEADHLHPFDVEVRKTRICTSASLICPHGMLRDKFTNYAPTLFRGEGGGEAL